MLNWCYRIYRALFWCKRGIINTLFQEDAPLKKLEIEIPEPKYPWVYIAAVIQDDTESDVTTLVETAVKPGEVLTPDRLSEITGITNAIRWEYLSMSTFEVQVISSEGLVNEVKWKSE
jgi:hypothetical protein